MVNIVETTIHFGLGIKPRPELFGLNRKFKAALRKRLSEMKIFIIDKLSMVLSYLWSDINSSLGEIFIMISGKAFAGLSFMNVAYLLQLPPVKGIFRFSQLSDNDSMIFVKLAVMAFI